MNARIARKVCRESAWADVKCMPWSCTRHKGRTVIAAMRKVRRMGEPVHYYDRVRMMGRRKICFRFGSDPSIPMGDWIGKPVTLGQPGPQIGAITGAKLSGDGRFVEVEAAIDDTEETRKMFPLDGVVPLKKADDR